MIVRMTKVEVIGPKELLLEVLELVRELGVFQMEPELSGFAAAGAEGGLRPFPLDRKALEERLFLEELRRKIDELLDCLPPVAAEEMALDPRAVLDAVSASVQEQGARCRELTRKREELRREAEELGRHVRFLEPLAPLVAEVGARTDLDFIGLQVREPGALEEIMTQLARATGGRFEVVSAVAADGTIAALITLPRGIGGAVRLILSEGRVPELPFPASLAGLSFPERVRRLKERLALLPAEMAAVEEELENLSRRWAPLCRLVRRWLEERLSLLRATACVHATSLCFFIHGWVPAEAVAGLREALDGRFGGRVAVEEREVLEQELERVPVALKNPPFFRPFELLVGFCRSPATLPSTRPPSSGSSSPSSSASCSGMRGTGSWPFSSLSPWRAASGSGGPSTTRPGSSSSPPWPPSFSVSSSGSFSASSGPSRSASIPWWSTGARPSCRCSSSPSRWG